MANDINNLKNLKYAELAGQLAANYNTQHLATGALDMHAEGSEERFKCFVEGSYSTPQSLKNTALLAEADFKTEMNKYKPSELADFYAPTLDAMSPEQKGILLGKFSSEKTMGEIEAHQYKNQCIVDAPEGAEHSDQERIDAQAELDSYEDFNMAKGFLGFSGVERIRGAAMEKYEGRTLDTLINTWKTA